VGYGFAIVSELCQPSNGVYICTGLYSGYAAPNDQFSQVTVATAYPENDIICPCVRITDNGSSLFNLAGYVFDARTYGNGYTLLAGGSNIAAGSITYVAGDTLAVAAVGTTIFCLHNGTQVTSVTNTTYTSGITALGLYSTDATAAYVQASLFAVGSASIVSTYSISGNAGIAGATVAWTGTSSGSTIADGSGNFTTSGLSNGPYTITPSKTGYTFSPTSSAQTVSGSNISGVNFTAQGAVVGNHSISGNAGVPGATITYTGTASGSVKADSTGTYTIPSLGNGTYTLTPSLTNYTFSPSSASKTVSTTNVLGANFTAAGTTSPWSQVDSRKTPNSTVDVQGTQTYTVPKNPSHAPPVDSRVSKPVDCRKSPNIPVNSRKTQV
jgi:inhibitor of cysteine peptidase